MLGPPLQHTRDVTVIAMSMIDTGIALKAHVITIVYFRNEILKTIEGINA